MELFFRLTLLAILTSSIMGFGCGSMTEQSFCTQISPCQWVNDACIGMYVPSCTTPACYFVDPLQGLDTQDGKAATPFKTLTPALQALVGKAGDIWIVNNGYGIEVELLKYAITNSAINIK